MDLLRIQGGVRLSGEVSVSGAKNAALPIMAASILAGGPVWLEHIPDLADVDTLALLLGHLGVEVKRQLDGRVRLETIDPRPRRAPRMLVRRMRASICILGPLLARRGHAVVPLPGGCRIGPRPIDLHLEGLARLGAEIDIRRGSVVARARRLVGATIHLTGPCGPTVTGTANILSAAVLARGRTIILGAAREPEVVDLGNFLRALGARIDGLGSSTLEIDGVDELDGGAYSIIPDRIEAGTLLLAGAMTGGQVRVRHMVPAHLTEVLSLLEAAGATVRIGDDWVELIASEPPRPTDAIARPYPGLPTDLQAQWTALMAVARGSSVVGDQVFGTRFRHVRQLKRLGANIRQVGDRAIIEGVPHLAGATVTACDLRASAALVLAGLAASGETIVRRIHHLDRGYAQLEAKLAALGARIAREPSIAKSAMLIQAIQL
jgi:UDP-N-acetylglucosamine 1-carboxyvinyltransferase